MTDEAMKKLTLGDLERIAARFSAAVASIREGQQLLGGGHGAQREAATAFGASGHETAPPISEDDAAAAHRARQFQPPEQPGGKSAVLTAAEVAERNALMGRRRVVDPDLPDDIKRLENGQ